MKTRAIGSLQVSVVGLGCNNFGRRCDAEEAAKVVGTCLDAGITFFDTADIYGVGASEEYLGRALGSRRDEAVIATKFGGPMGGEGEGGAGAAWIAKAAENSLKRLGTDRIDLYQLHFPDQTVDAAETLGALDQLVRDGKVREIGCSNFSGEQIESADAVSRDNGWARYVSAQNHYNLLHRDPEADVLPAAERLGLGVLPYFPLASGLLTGKYQRDAAPPEGTRLAGLPPERAARVLSDEHFDKVEKLGAFAAERGHTLLELAFAWLLAKPALASVIAGATKPDQAKANAATADWELSADEVAQIDQIAGGA